MSRSALRAADSSSGLPSNQIQKMARDAQGRLWLAGPAGLSCFDGTFVRSFDRRNGLECSGLRSVGTTSDGTVWVGTDLGLEILDKDGRPRPLTPWSQWPYGLCEHIDTSAGAIWIGTAQGVVRIDPNSGLSDPRIAFHADLGFVRHLVGVSDVQVYLASDRQGLVEVYGTSWQRIRSSKLSGRHITRVVPDQQGHLFVGTDEGVMVLDLATKEIRVTLSVPQTAAVTALALSQDHCWAAFGQVLAAFSLSALDQEPVEVYHLGSRINDLMLDEVGNIWIGTDTQGLFQVSGLRHALQHIDMGKDAAVFSIKPISAESYDIGGSGIFGTLPLTTTQTHSSLHGPAGLPETTVWDSFQDASGTWAATHAGLYHAPQGGDFVRVFSRESVLNAPARVIVSYRNELWVGTLHGLARIRDGEVTEVRPANGPPLGYIYALQVDTQERLWIATLGRGLWLEDGNLEQVLRGPLSATGNTFAVVEGPNKEFLVLQDEKVILLDPNGSARLVAELHPVSGWSALWLDQRTVALGSSEGLRLLDIETGQITMTVRSLLSAPDWEFTNNRTLVRDSKGKLLCGINGGLVRVDLAQLRLLLIPPVPHLTEVFWHGVTPESRATGYWLHPGRWSVQVRAFTAWFVDHTQVRYRFKLVGFDSDWSELQARAEVSYTSLPYGDYEVMIQAHTPLTGYGPAVSLCKITVAREWWAKGWTAALASGEAFLDRLVRSSSHNKIMLERNRTLEQEVTERTAVLRAANEKLEQVQAELALLAQTDGLTQLVNRRHFDQALSQEVKRARRQHTPLSLLLLDIDHFKAVNDRLGHQVGDDYLRALAKVFRVQVRESIDTVARYGGEEFAIILVGTLLEQAQALAERIRVAVAALELPNEGSPYGHVTLSIGLTSLELSEAVSEDELVKRADGALYKAKHLGRNRSVAWSPALAGVLG